MNDNVQSLTVLLVSDLEASKAYYRDVLGCDVTEWWAIRDDFVKLGFKLLQANSDDMVNPNSKSGQKVCDVYAYTEDIATLDELYKEWQDKGASIVIEPTITAFDWGKWKEFAVQDPDGYVIGIGTAQKSK
jgi:lactoylglutathione lyase